jgi:YbgC/YbaW family acyl-CoA thioester hydrolase
MTSEHRRLSYRVSIRRHETDSFGHVNNAVYLNYLEEANCDIMEQLGIPISLLKQQGIVILLKRVLLDFLAPAFHGDTLTFESWLIDMQEASGTWRHEVFNQHRALILLAEDTGVFMSTVTHRPVQIPDLVRTAVVPYYAPAPRALAMRLRPEHS